MKKYKDFYKEEKQWHEEALQRYQKDHADEMEIINLHKKCNKKAWKVSQKASPQSDEPKKASPKSDGPKKVLGPREEGQKPKKASSNGKKTTTKAGKKVPKKAPKSPQFIDSSEEEEGSSKNASFAWSERRSPKFF